MEHRSGWWASGQETTLMSISAGRTQVSIPARVPASLPRHQHHHHGPEPASWSQPWRGAAAAAGGSARTGRAQRTLFATGR